MPNSWWASIDWQLVAVIVFGLLTLLLMILLFLLGRRKKRLSYCVLSESRLAGLTDAAPGNVQVLYDGKPVSNVYLVRIGFRNSGNLPIEAGDYEQPICVKVGGKSRLLSAKITKTEPLLDHVFVVDDGGLTASLSTKLLNKGDRLTFEFLIADYDGLLALGFRISGVDQLRYESEPPRHALAILALYVAGAVSFALTCVGASITPRPRWLVVALTTLVICLLAVTVLWEKQRKSRERFFETRQN